MSSASSTTALPTPKEIENLGILFIGFVAATVLYGLTFFQTYIYYTRYTKDSWLIRYFVAALSILDTAATALVSEVIYYYLIDLFDVDVSVLYATNTFCAQFLLSIVLTFLSHLFFALRVFQVTGGSWPLMVVLGFLGLVAFAFGLTATVQMFIQQRLSAFGASPMEITFALGLAAGVIADLIVVAVMTYSLRRSRYPEIPVLRGWIPIVLTALVGRGASFTVIQLAYFCVFIAMPSTQYWIPWQMVACKIYVNTLFAHLNSRDVHQGQGLYEEDSLTDRKVSTSRRLPSSIRFDIKTTTQSIALHTRNTDTESDHTELESRKTFNDSVGNEYTQVSSGSSRSQPDIEIDKRSISEPLSA